MTKARALPVRTRLGVAARVAAALAGGYAVAALVAIALGVALPVAREEAGTAGALAGMLALPVAAMGCFWARSALRAWAGILIAAALFGGIALLAGWRP
ncbi:DUF3649 domain-containing protein [Sphingomonas sp. PR090111-T3T-6A]|uniref:DUF3649 domain-containing protein n=1 Tax=Sphingomonas sp. PR090111-T3T-6A TaxID=685778 RepID=UPI00035CA7CF|nr:DUF3649 domain-containing protein [Sphingomonas sp. PR090111-T3T-6A]